MSTLGGRVLDDEVFAGCTLHDALHQLDVAADAVLLVHDEVAGRQLERIDLLAASRRHLALGAVGGALPDEVVVRHDGELQRRRHEAVVELAEDDLHDARRRRGHLVVERGGDVVLGEPLDGSLRLAVSGRDEDDLLALGDPRADVGQGGRRVAAVGRGGLHLDRARLLVAVSETERGDREPACDRGRASRGVRRRACGMPPSRGRSALRHRWLRQPTMPGGTPRWSRRGRRRGLGCARDRTAGSPTSPAAGRRAAPSHRSAPVSATPCPRRRGPRPAW